MTRFKLRLALIVLFCTAATNSAYAAIEYANITGGRVQGEIKDGLASFKGLPFAAPPVGALRWQNPHPIDAWSGVRKADTFARACIQPWADNPEPKPSEDCLYLNVWTAAATAKEHRPVMVWIHGGGLTNGMSWQNLSYGTKLAPDPKASGFGTIIDGQLIVGSNEDLFQQARFNDTAILVGFNTDELGATPPIVLVDWMESVIGGSTCSKAQFDIAKAYPRTNDPETSMLRYLYRDFYVGWPTWEWARLQSRQGHNHAYVYIFDVHDPDHSFGAWHAAEYPFVFGNFPKPSRDEAVSALIRQYWINFAARGDPNGPGLPVWKAFDEESQIAMIFSDSSHSQRLPNVEGLKALDELLHCVRPQKSTH